MDAAFGFMLAEAGLPMPETEFKFLTDRKFRLDYAWPERKLALEQEGGVWKQGRHTRGSGFIKDMEKYNLLAATGWRLLRCTPDQLHTTATIELIAMAINAV